MAETAFATDIRETAERLGEAAHEFAGKTVVLSGARGFLGRRFTGLFSLLNEQVLKKPCRVLALDNLIVPGDQSEAPADGPGVRFIHHDVIKPFECVDPVHYVVHAAGIASPFYYRAYPLETLEVSVSGTRNLLELATRHHARFTFFSSSEIYGDPDPRHVPTPESYRGNVSCRGPRSCYDESKRVGETLAHVFHEKFGTATTTIRPFNIYGPGMPENDYRVLPSFASQIRKGMPLRVYGAGTQTRTYCYVTDALVGFMLAVLRGVPGEAYNIGNPEPELTVLELVQRIEKVLGRKVDYHLIEYPDAYPADEPMRRCPDIRKARLQLRYEPRVDIDQGLGRFLSWAARAYSGR